MDHAGLGRIVVGMQLRAVDDATGHGGDVDDRAAAAGQHGPALGLGAEVDALQIDADDRVPRLFGQIFGRLRLAMPTLLTATSRCPQASITMATMRRT